MGSIPGKIPWRRKWQPTPEFLPEKIPRTEEPGGPQSMGCREADVTEATANSTARGQI